MKYKLIWLTKAIEELNNIRIYIEIEKKAPQAALKLVEKIYNSAESLEYNAKAHQKDNIKPNFRRMVVTSNFSIFYQIKGDKVFVAHIWNNRRDKKKMK